MPPYLHASTSARLRQLRYVHASTSPCVCAPPDLHTSTSVRPQLASIPPLSARLQGATRAPEFYRDNTSQPPYLHVKHLTRASRPSPLHIATPTACLQGSIPPVCTPTARLHTSGSVRLQRTCRLQRIATPPRRDLYISIRPIDSPIPRIRRMLSKLLHLPTLRHRFFIVSNWTLTSNSRIEFPYHVLLKCLDSPLNS